MKTTEKSSEYTQLENMSISEIVTGMNNEDKKVAIAVEKSLPQIIKLADAVAIKVCKGGRLFYLGAGTSGRLGILDASECPPTFGVEHGRVVGLISGGDSAIRKAVEFAEDDAEQGWKDLLHHNINSNDFVIGIAASGTTPYVIGALAKCKENNIETGCITCNTNTPLIAYANFPVEVVTGAEFVTGSTRLKAGTAQKMVLNIISTTAMIKLGRVKGNKMVDMQLSNNKLIDRGTRMVMEETELSEDEAKKLLLSEGSVRKAILKHRSNARD